jgi:uncharacterized protein (TIGR03382 family)
MRRAGERSKSYYVWHIFAILVPQKYLHGRVPLLAGCYGTAIVMALLLVVWYWLLRRFRLWPSYEEAPVAGEVGNEVGAGQNTE